MYHAFWLQVFRLDLVPVPESPFHIPRLSCAFSSACVWFSLHILIAFQVPCFPPPLLAHTHLFLGLHAPPLSLSDDMNLSPLRDVLERIAEDAQERLIYVAERVGRQSEREAQRKEGRQGEREW
jgi:hypothetical protein